ncbi:hypothetical protein GW17_00033655 [Ensete ventricosum]|nr:hypothetical protein GW17_00033655 [Ensete ventricosum]
MVALRETLLLLLPNLFWGAIAARPCSGVPSDMSYCLSWRVAVEANNAQAWRTVPAQCTRYVEDYMLGGQYNRDLDTAIDQIFIYLNGTLAADDGMDAWILDVDDTCLSNLLYYKDKHFGRAMARPATASPSTGTRTITLEEPSPSSTSRPSQPPPHQTLVLRLKRPKKVSWKEGTVDNEFLNRKSSKKCCIFHAFDEDDSDEEDDGRGPSGGAGPSHRSCSHDGAH